MKDQERSQDRDSSAGHGVAASFDAFYDFAFPRVYRFAQRHTKTESEAEALCRLVLIRALASLGGLGALEDGVHRGSVSPVAGVMGDPASPPPPQSANPADLAFWLYCVARKTADQIERNPALLRTDRLHAEMASVTTGAAAATGAQAISWPRVRVPNR